MSAPRAKLILHIGQHKTGSKALQSFLARHASALARRGIHYPLEKDPAHGIRAYAISHYRLFALLRAEAMAACGGTAASDAWRAAQSKFHRPFDSVRDFFDSLERERDRAGAHTLLLSAEDLLDMHTAHETGFMPAWIGAAAEILSRLAREWHYDPLVIVYLRRQDHLLGAHYVQFIKGSPVNDTGFEEFARAFSPRLHSHDLLIPWAAAFGEGNLRVRPYEPAALPGGIVPDFFERFLGFPVPADWTPPPADVESVNATPRRDLVEYIRLLNRRNRAGQPVPAREDVLQAAMEPPSGSSGAPRGIAEWMSPASRRTLLEHHAPGNTAIAALHLDRPAGPLFAEPIPQDDHDRPWREYPGLDAERTAAIEWTVREIETRRLSAQTASPSRPGWWARWWSGR